MEPIGSIFIFPRYSSENPASGFAGHVRRKPRGLLRKGLPGFHFPSTTRPAKTSSRGDWHVLKTREATLHPGFASHGLGSASQCVDEQ